MPTALCWRHVTINTRCSWLPGDKRGFRSRRHRIHSSGDYKNPPPSEEHSGLRRFHMTHSGHPVSFDLERRILILRAFVLKLRGIGYRIIACSVGAHHLHALAELPRSYEQVKREIGRCKQRSSHLIQAHIPGSIWSEGGRYEIIRDLGHLRNTYDYIRLKQEPGAVVWSHRPDEDWITDPDQGVVVMAPLRKQIRVFARAHTPACEQREHPDHQ